MATYTLTEQMQKHRDRIIVNEHPAAPLAAGAAMVAGNTAGYLGALILKKCGGSVDKAFALLDSIKAAIQKQQ